jgi:hypothetical protein
MRTEISLTVTPSDRRQLKALVRDHNAPQKHVWRAESVLLMAEGVGTNENHAPHGRVQDLHRWQNTGIGVPGATAIAATITDAKVVPQPGHREAERARMQHAQRAADGDTAPTPVHREFGRTFYRTDRRAPCGLSATPL